MPKISVISIAKNEDELNALKDALSKQTYKDFEFIVSTKGTIPEAWNDAISRAKGEFLVFTESDASPLNETWLEEISKHLEKNTIVKGLEITPTNLDMCNLVADVAIFKKIKFDETFPVEEDSELFARLRRNDVAIKQINAFPVIHTPSISWGKTLSRAFLSGHLQMKINKHDGRKEGKVNKDALVTGSSRDIGRAIAIELAKSGIDIVVNNDGNPEEGIEVVNEIKV